jgi:hypothetical protein
VNDEDDRARIRRLVGVYNANGTLRGELAYLISARLGHAHCALCDITHATIRERGHWRVCRDALPVPFDTYHLDDQHDAVQRVTGSDRPAVIAETDHGLIALLGPDDLERCHGSPEGLTAALEQAAARHHLEWPN